MDAKDIYSDNGVNLTSCFLIWGEIVSTLDVAILKSASRDLITSDLGISTNGRLPYKYSGRKRGFKKEK